MIRKAQAVFTDSASSRETSGPFIQRSTAAVASVSAVETGDRTAETLRDLVQELEEKMPTAADDDIIADLTTTATTITARRYTGGVPVWLASIAIIVILVGAAFVIVQPWNEPCEFGGDLCKIADIDLDVLERTIPDSDLLELLPDMGLLDQYGDMTAGELFSLEKFDDVNFALYLSDSDIDRLLDVAG